MSSPVEEIKSRLDLVELIQSYTRLQKAGINYKANCPFHTEKTPSFFVSPTRQIWHCFGCGKGGDHFKFIMEVEGHDFPEALRTLATRAGVVLRREDPAIRSERNRLYDLCEEAAKVFERSLALTPAARTYLKGRGLEEETIKEFGIGFAPQSWDFLLKALGAKGFKKEEVEKAGLAVRSEDGSSWYDRFRSRIIFPIHDAAGRTVGFGGRIFEVAGDKAERSNEAKYVNTPNTLIYDKSQVLYGFDKAKQEIRQKNQVVVVEGYMDCLMSLQAGVKNTVAVSGTALTPWQLKTLRRLCETVVSSFDADAAGESATKRSLSRAAEFGFERKITLLPSGKDPADVAKDDAKLWQEAVESAKDAVEFYFEKSFRSYDPRDPQGKKTISATVLPYIAELSHEIEKAHWIGELARRLGVEERAVWSELAKISKKASYDSSSSLAEKEDSFRRLPARKELLEERLLALLTLVEGEKRERWLENRSIVFASSVHQELFAALTGGPSSRHLTPPLAGVLEMIRFKGEIIGAMTNDLPAEFSVCARELEKECVKEKLLILGEEVARKEKEGDHAEVASLLHDFRALSDKLKKTS